MKQVFLKTLNFIADGLDNLFLKIISQQEYKHQLQLIYATYLYLSSMSIPVWAMLHQKFSFAIFVDFLKVIHLFLLIFLIYGINKQKNLPGSNIISIYMKQNIFTFSLPNTNIPCFSEFSYYLLRIISVDYYIFLQNFCISTLLSVEPSSTTKTS